MQVTQLAVTPDIEALIERAGRVCYKSGFVGDGALIKALIKNGHTSVLEHGSFTFLIEGISRACTHQLVRHRIASYSQESQRYVKFDTGYAELPNEYKDNEVVQLIYSNCMEYCEAAYHKLLGAGVKKEDARMVLPNGSLSTIVVTMNCRALRNFFELRTTKHAQKEIREIAITMLRLCNVAAPNVFGDLYERTIL